MHISSGYWCGNKRRRKEDSRVLCTYERWERVISTPGKSTLAAVHQQRYGEETKTLSTGSFLCENYAGS